MTIKRSTNHITFKHNYYIIYLVLYNIFTNMIVDSTNQNARAKSKYTQKAKTKKH